MRKLLAICFLLPLASFGQREGIVTFRDNLVVTSVLNTKSESFGYSNSKGQDIEYSTADITGIGIGVDYRWLTFEFSKRLKSNSSDGLYGHTENFGIGFGFTMPKWYFRNFLEMYSGYHLTNPDYISFNYLDSVGMYPYRPDITTVRYLATWNYVFNSDHYSTMASLWQLERQEKSAGSVVAGVTYTMSAAVGDSAFIPRVQEGNFPVVKDWNGVGGHLLAFNVGYQYTLVLSKSKKWFVHLGLNPGVGVSWSNATVEGTGEVIDLGSKAAFAMEGRFIFGYNGDRWYYGVTSIGYSGATGGRDYSPLASFSSYNRLYLGYRFTLPDHVVTTLEKIGL